MRKLFSVCFAILLLNSVFAKQVSEQDAKQAAVKFYSERASRPGSVVPSPFQVTATFTIRENSLTLYYAFNINDRGFVIIAAEDAVVPVLAYSFEGNYPALNPAPQFVAWMAQYERQISHARKTKADPFPVTVSAWKHLLTPGDLLPLQPSGTTDVDPMIRSDWNQPAPYNEMCPADPAGSSGHAIVGCVPVAMGQIMYYYRWPDHGTGSCTYYDSTYGFQHASFDSTWYRWENMKNTIATSDSGIAQLLYHLGVSVDLKYGPSSSGMYNHKAAYSLRTYFKYSPETRYVFRDSTSLNWDSLILAHLARRMPLYYAGWSVPNIYGHAFVCDGNQGSDYFHFNFGWSGSSNGYFYLDDLTPGGNNFNLAQELIINIYPDTLHYTYPPNCTGAHTLTYNQGSLTDGSGPTHNYQAGADCSWLIDPQTSTDSISGITLTFDGFETGAGDQVTVYNGASVSSPVLGTFSGSTLPAGISSTGNKMLITFHAGGSTPSPGWSAGYSTILPVFCSGTETVTADTLEITDGSLRFHYNNYSSCRWKIEPENGKKPLTVYFKAFDTEPLKDALTLFDFESSQQLAVISGHYGTMGLPDSVTSPSGKIYAVFTTNSSVTADGFVMYYPRYASGIVEKSGIAGLTIYPNPAHDRVHVDFYSTGTSRMIMTLSNLQAQSLEEISMQCHAGKNQLTLPLNNLPSGIYLLRLKDDDTSETHKIIITDHE